MIDLHLHTNMSDGSDTPQELLEKIAKMDCRFFSITDHDDLRANTIIQDLLKKKKLNAKYITGLEMAAVYKGRNLHLLCYGFNPKDKNINDMILEGARLRKQRIIAMFDHLHKKHNICIPQEEQDEILSLDIPGKVHVALAAMKLGINMTRQELFDNCLNDMESREYKISAEIIINIVKSAGGIVSFAHPIEVQEEYNLDYVELDKMVKELRLIGLGAIEVYHSLHRKEQVEEYGKIAKKYDLLVSAGSDYHGKNKAVKIGELTACGYTPKEKEVTILSFFQ